MPFPRGNKPQVMMQKDDNDDSEEDEIDYPYESSSDDYCNNDRRKKFNSISTPTTQDFQSWGRKNNCDGRKTRTSLLNHSPHPRENHNQDESSHLSLERTDTRVNHENVAVRRSSRSNKGVPPLRYGISNRKYKPY